MGPIQPVTPISANASQLFAEPGIDAQAIATLNANDAFGAGNELVVTQDENNRRPVLQVVDRESRVVLQQISPPTVRMMFRRLSAKAI